jgi:hypothetical protein
MHYKPVPGTGMYEQTLDDSVSVGGLIIPIPKGFKFDGASIPKAFWQLIGTPFDPDFIDAARTHDYCFLTRCVGFKMANIQFYEDLKHAGVSAWKRQAMYQAVNSMFGRRYYRKDDVEGLKHLASVLHGRPDAGFYSMYVNVKGFPRGFV